MWIGGWWMAVSMLLFWAGVIVLLVWGIRTFSDRARPPEPPRRALEVLEERLARGEIDVEEFEQRRAALEGRQP